MTETSRYVYSKLNTKKDLATLNDTGSNSIFFFHLQISLAQENNHENNGADEEEDMEIDDSSGVTLNQTHWNHEVHARGASFGFSAPFMASYYRCVQVFIFLYLKVHK